MIRVASALISVAVVGVERVEAAGNEPWTSLDEGVKYGFECV